mmetsp:Transcript_8921/g.11150  ORF Transcript_8921/g.11150 Transcript_8921/m.11150 type:complete len:368 (-) Transcript_8921:331-1434(-)
MEPDLLQMLNNPHNKDEDTSYRRKFWSLDLFLVLLLCGGLILSVSYAVESDLDEDEQMSKLALTSRIVAFKLITYLFIWLPAAFLLRTYLLKSWIGVSDEHYYQIMVNRDQFHLEELQEVYTDIRIRKFDCAVRKGFHFIFFASGLIVEFGFLARGYTSIMVLADVIHGLVYNMLRCISLYGNLFTDNLYVQSWLYFAPRVRDGREAYINIRVAQALTALSTPVCNIMLDQLTHCGPKAEEADRNIAQSMAFLVFLPVALGDAMGEVVGSFYGKHQFEVKGFGEVNKKSLEGCAAVFTFSLIATMLSTFVVWPDELPLLWKILLPICVSTLSTLTETIAFRSTDNFVIPVCNAIIVMIVYEKVRNEC